MVVGTFVDDLVCRSGDVYTESGTIVNTLTTVLYELKGTYLKFSNAYIVPLVHVCIFKTKSLDSS